MTVESLIKSAIADEVNVKLDPKTVKDLVTYVSSSAFFNDFDRHLLGRNYVFEIQQLTITPGGAGCECLCSGETVADALRSIGFDWKKVAVESW